MDSTPDKTSQETGKIETKPTSGQHQKEVILSEVPVRVQKIHVDGLQRTRDDIVSKHVQNVFKAKNFEEMVKFAHIAKSDLEKLGLFKSIGIAIDISRGDKALPDGYDITYKVKEQRRVTGGLSTLVGTNEGTMVCSMRLPNCAGRGERFTADFTYGSKNALGWSLNFNKPLLGDPNLLFQTGVFQNSCEFPWSGYKELDRGLAVDLMFPSFLGNHNLRWEGAWRELSCLTRTTAFKVREEAGHTLKSAFKHTWSKDTRDSRVLPNTGYLLKTTHELAGFGGDAHFLKQEVECQYNKTLFWDTVVQLSLAGGIMNPLTRNTKVNIMDRFFLGGPLTLRGFNLKGAGPHEDGCALGADTYWCSGLHLYTPLPFRPGKGGFGDYFKTHFFVGAGNLNSFNRHISLKDNVSSLFDAFRWSYGAGIVLRLGGIARLEVNYCVPVRAQKGDNLNPGLQFGVGVTFL